MINNKFHLQQVNGKSQCSMNSSICSTCIVNINSSEKSRKTITTSLYRRNSFNHECLSRASSFRTSYSSNKLNKNETYFRNNKSLDLDINKPSISEVFINLNSNRSSVCNLYSKHTAFKQIQINSSTTKLYDDKEVVLRENQNRKPRKYLSTASIYLIDEKQNTYDDMVPSTQIRYSNKFITSLTHSPIVSRVKNVINRFVPELDETVGNSSNGTRDHLNNPNFTDHAYKNTNRNTNSSEFNFKMSRQMNSANKNTRNELTLPPIAESKVSSSNFKKSNSSTRVDSGIAVDYANDNHNSGGSGGGGAWTSNASENGAENVITTIEIVENNSLKKNATSSTLNSYGKSSSIQSKASGYNAVNGKVVQNKQNNKITASLTPSNVASSEANYLASIEKLNNLNVNNDEDYLTVNKKTNDTSNKNQPAKAKDQKFDTLSRQNTITTINNHESLPLVSKQNANQNGNATTPSNNPSPTQQKPVPKPRRTDKRANSLQRQSTIVLPEHSQFLKDYNDKKVLKRENTNLVNKPVNANVATNQVSRPKTGNANTKTLVSFNINSDDPTKIEVETSRPIKPIVNNDIDILKFNDDVNVLAALDMLENDEAAMNDFTMARIMKWLEDIENCNNMMQPPSQLAWNNANGNSKRTDLPSDVSRNFNNEYCLSDYDSLDEQIIEYNRVVDKTFHIVHDED